MTGAQPDAQPEARPLEVELHVAPQPDGTFVGESSSRAAHVFGGMLVGQALHAAQLTVEAGRTPHSLHASFVGAPSGAHPLRYLVEETRSGSSFSARRILATQHDQVVFTMQASFQEDEEGPTYAMPADADVADLVGPDGLTYGRYATRWFDSRDIPVTDETRPPHVRRAWFKARLPLPDDPIVHLHALAYMTDHGATRAIRQPHAGHPGLERRRSVSLDHSVWFHGRARVDEWLLSEMHPVFSGGGRGLATGHVRTRDGRLLATVTQEALFRVPQD